MGAERQVTASPEIRPWSVGRVKQSNGLARPNRLLAPKSKPASGSRLISVQYAASLNSAKGQPWLHTFADTVPLLCGQAIYVVIIAEHYFRPQTPEPSF